MAKKKSLELMQEGDSQRFRTAILRCQEKGLPVARVSVYQLKVGPFNLYPDRGSWNADFDQAKKSGGVEAFLRQAEEWCLIEMHVAIHVQKDVL